MKTTKAMTKNYGPARVDYIGADPRGVCRALLMLEGNPAASHHGQHVVLLAIAQEVAQLQSELGTGYAMSVQLSDLRITLEGRERRFDAARVDAMSEILDNACRRYGILTPGGER